MKTAKIPGSILVLALVGGSWATALAAEDKFYEAFLNPPAEARPFVRWWWNGDCVTEEEILRELDVMKAAGIGGVEINPVAMPGAASAGATEPLVWLSPEWSRMAGVATRGARERGMIADMIVGSGWPFGGRFLKSDETIQGIGLNRKAIKGPGVFKGEIKDLMKAPRIRYRVEDATEPRMVYLRLVPKRAVRIEECLDLADKVKPDGTLEFEIPEGEHTLHIGTWQESFTAVVHGAPGSDGQVLNHLNKAAVERYLERMSTRLGPALGGTLGGGLRAMFCDSIELSGANWTTDFAEEFHRRRGYRLEPWYPFALADPHDGYRDLPADPEFADEIRRVRYDFNKQNPWWPHFRKWADYNARHCSVLQSSQARAEVAILGPTPDVWSDGGLERQGFIHTPWYLHLMWQAVQQNGCTADFINRTALQNATFKDGKLLHGPMAYDLLVVANVRSLEPETAKAIEQYANAGGKIAFVGGTPDRSAGFNQREEDDKAVKNFMTAALQTDSRRVAMIGEPDKEHLLEWVTKTLDRFTVRPAVRISTPNPMLFQVHHAEDGREIFLFSNQDNEMLSSFAGRAVYRVEFKVAGVDRTILSLGRVHGVSEVTLNGMPLGGRGWGTEHLYDATGVPKAGE